jgi:hypothetical protein
VVAWSLSEAVISASSVTLYFGIGLLSYLGLSGFRMPKYPLVLYRVLWAHVKKSLLNRLDNHYYWW